MKTIEELQHDLKAIYNELESIKNSQRETEAHTINFKEIVAKAERYPITDHPMLSEDEHTQQMYLLVLLSVAALDDEAYVESFCTIYRIVYGICYCEDVQELFLSAKQMNFEKLDECTRLFGSSQLRLILILDCLLIAGGFEKEKRKAMEYISELCVLLKITSEEITFLSNLARVVLTQDLSQYKCDILNTYGELFDCYIDAFKDEFKIEQLLVNTQEKVDQRDCYLKSYTIDNDIIQTQFVEIGGLFSGSKDAKIDRIKIKGGYSVDILIPSEAIELFVRVPGFYRLNEKSPEKLMLGIISNHPLAHNKALKEYARLGGKTPEEYEQQIIRRNEAREEFMNRFK